MQTPILLPPAPHMPPPSSPIAEFDVVIVGAGSAGCAIAARLSEDPHCRVLLVEAGGRDGQLPFEVPGAQVFIKGWSRYAWLHEVQPDHSRAGRPDEWRRGRILGGSSTINGLIWAHGLPSDFDGWAAQGLDNWSWREVQPWFARCEAYAQAVEGDGRGRSGPVTVQRWPWAHPFARTLMQACGDQGMRVVDDINAVNEAAIGVVQTNQRHGRRVSSSAAYLRPARGRQNLTVWTNTRATRVCFDGPRASGVELVRDGQALTATARREVVLSAGAILSPLLLMQSGIGPGAQLQAHGIQVRVDAPEVGSNLSEHPELYVDFEIDQPTYSTQMQLRSMLSAGWQYLRHRGGPATSPGTHALGYAHSGCEGPPAPGLPPDLLLFCGPWGRLVDASTFQGQAPVFSMSPSVCRPRSRGTVRLASGDPMAPPRIDANLLGDDDDVRRLIAGVRLVHRLLKHPAVAPHVRRLVSPGPDVLDDEALAAWVRRDTSICYHANGTCRMGVDERAVLDAQLCVRGVKGLRVADASVMPIITSGNLNAPVTMIGERAAHFIQQAT
jgi:choline dehydrogenase